MKKLKLTSLNLKDSELLNRSQLKMIFGGSGGGGDEETQCDATCKTSTGAIIGYVENIGDCNDVSCECDRVYQNVGQASCVCYPI